MPIPSVSTVPELDREASFWPTAEEIGGLPADVPVPGNVVELTDGVALLAAPLEGDELPVRSLLVAFGFGFSFLLSGWIFRSFKVSMGKSATPIIIWVAVPMIAVAPPEIGSQGPSSASYSRDRNLYAD
jgi:hypothetical protein